MKILAIGNSFSQDSTAYVEDIAKSIGHRDITAANLYIGGCPLSHHAENLKTNAVEYDYQRHGNGLYKTSIREALKSDTWDIITLQQVSGLSGLYDTYHLYIDEVYSEVKRLCPNAVVYLNRTWAYEEGSAHPHFEHYNHDRAKMDAAIEDCYQKISAEFSAEIIPVGNVITALKKLPEFDIAKGGISLYRDAFHLSLTYGRFAAACVWLKKLCGMRLDSVSFVPENADAALIQKVVQFIEGYFQKD